MKKTLYFLLFFLGLVISSQAQEKTFCDLVENYTKDAKKVYAGEILLTVPDGHELWIDMRPIAHQRNQGEEGGCRLVAGQRYVADKYTSEPKRAYDCGNPIKHSTMYVVNNGYQAHVHYMGCGHSGYQVKKPCNCPDDTNIILPQQTDNEGLVIMNDYDVNQNSGHGIPLSKKESNYNYDVNQNLGYLTACQLMWIKKYPEAYKLWLQDRNRKAFNKLNIPYGPDRRKMRRCFEGPSVLRVAGIIVGTAGIATGVYSIFNGSSGSSSGSSETWDGNPTN